MDIYGLIFFPKENDSFTHSGIFFWRPGAQLSAAAEKSRSAWTKMNWNQNIDIFRFSLRRILVHPSYYWFTLFPHPLPFLPYRHSYHPGSVRAHHELPLRYMKPARSILLVYGHLELGSVTGTVREESEYKIPPNQTVFCPLAPGFGTLSHHFFKNHKMLPF